MAHHIARKILPFTAIVGQEKMKQALILNAINPRIGGVLIRGEKGTAKSTAVRALAELLPEIEVVKGCSFNCNPKEEDEMCDVCYERIKSDGNLEVIKRKVFLVDLPLGATEDRVVGSLDVEKAIKEGIKALEPGILARANRGILYIDEVNLLDDHVADVLLDAAAMAVNMVEREGVSVAHPSKFILVGTMNPEEGELRPQLLDRFGLQAEVESIEDANKRVEIVKVVESFEKNPAEFKNKYEKKQNALRSKILKARENINDVEISDDLLKIIADMCIELGVRTHRAEIVIVRTAKTIAAFDGRTFVTIDDIKEAMELALPHRMRRKPFEPPSLDQDKLEDMMQNAQNQHEHKHDNPKRHEHKPKEEKKENKEMHQNQNQEQSETHSDTKNEEYLKNQGERFKPHEVGWENREFVFDIGDPIDTSPLDLKRKMDKTYRRKISGRRLHTLSLENGKYIKYKIPNDMRCDIALDATIRVAAPYQKERKSNNAISIKSQDIREKVRLSKVKTATMFVVDASGSMGAMNRMESAKGAVLSLLLDSYQKRDKVGMVAFRGESAEVLLPLCSSVDLALKSLKELPTGGKTPLSAGLEKGLTLLVQEQKKDKELIAFLVLISDGRANVSLGASEIKKELLNLSEQLKNNSINTIVIDTEVVKNFYEKIKMQLGYCKDIADYADGKYYPINNLTSNEIHSIVDDELSAIMDTLI
ncbi:MAG TPA: putative cobaltochelatase [Methanosarcinales archaeon]|nr:putative cobaltochelatase [Methanosarcinales archaeon]